MFIELKNNASTIYFNTNCPGFNDEGVGPFDFHL